MLGFFPLLDSTILCAYKIASAKRPVLAVQQEIFYTTHNDTDGAIPTIYVTYFWRVKTAINYKGVIFEWKNGRRTVSDLACVLCINASGQIYLIMGGARLYSPCKYEV